MLYLTDYYWFNNFNESDILWLDESLNWDEAISFTLTSYLPFLSLVSSAMLNSHYSSDWLVVTSFAEAVLVLETLKDFTVVKLFNFVFLDLAILTQVQYSTPISLLFHSDYQDLLVTLVYHSPELVLALSEWASHVFNSNALNSAPSAVFDSYQDNPNLSLSEFVEYVILFLMHTWLILLSFNVFRYRLYARFIEPVVEKLKYYLHSEAASNRLQSEAVFEVAFLAGLFLFMMIMFFDDDREENIEFFNLTLLYVFAFVFFYHLFKYSLHYLNFLDSSKQGSSSVYMIFNQFLSDFLNLIGFSLRFFLLMVRLNVYDGVDDIFDSYYIFLIDFDEDEYFAEGLTDFSSFSFFDSDVQDDRSFLLEDESDLSIDFYTIYFILWGKYVLYLFLFIEEIARVALALAVTHLLIFEINAVTRSSNVDTYISVKRS